MSRFDELKEASRKRGEHRDCTVKALAAVTACSYNDTHDAMAQAGRKARRGCHLDVMERAAKTLGFEMVKVDRSLYRAKTVRTAPRDGKLQSGAYILNFSGHVAALVEGQVIDWTAGRLHRIRDVYKVVQLAARKVAIIAPAHNWAAVPTQLGMF